MRNLRVLFLRLVVDAVLALAGFGALCGICFVFFGATEDFKFWFVLIYAFLFVVIATDEIRAFINAQNKKRR